VALSHTFTLALSKLFTTVLYNFITQVFLTFFIVPLTFFALNSAMIKLRCRLNMRACVDFDDGKKTLRFGSWVTLFSDISVIIVWEVAFHLER
jgi:hypothetical protein